MARSLLLAIVMAASLAACFAGGGGVPPSPGAGGVAVIYPFSSGLSTGDLPLEHGGETEIALAGKLRPHLFFDTSERWQPLAIDAFLDERFADGTRHHLWSDRDYLEIHGTGRDGKQYFSPAAGRCMDAGHARDAKTPPRCDAGATSAIYYRRTTHGGLWYWDFWAFYRYNDYTGHHNHCWFVCDDHEGDWEGVTIATTRDVLAPIVVGAIYAEHADRIAVAGSALDADLGHVDVYVAAGTHASYRYRCATSCDQHIGARFEEPHDGDRPWPGNDDDACRLARCVRALPEVAGAADEADPRPSAWNAWTASWGSTCRPACALRIYSGPSPQAPGQQTRYRCPWLATRVDQGREPVLGLLSRLPAKAVTPALLGDVCRGLLPAPELTTPALVALGDSYSAGVGARNYDGKTTRSPHGCFRSADAWPLMVASELQLQGRTVACNGAKTPEILSSGVRHDDPEREISQLSRIGARPDILTITIGGNDVKFAEVLGNCVRDHDCTDRYVHDGDDEIESLIGELEPRLETLYRTVAAAVPGTRVVVVGYPRIFPRSIARTAVPNCAAWDRLSQDEVRWLNARGHSLDAAIARAAAAAHVEYVDVEDAFDGHELRCTGGAYVNVLKLRAGVPPYEIESFHPNTAGQRRLADMVTERLRS